MKNFMILLSINNKIMPISIISLWFVFLIICLIIIKYIKQSKIKTINVSFFLFIYVLYLEFIYKIFINNNLFSFNTIKTILFSLFIIIFLSILTSLFKWKVNKTLSYIVSIYLVVMMLAQIVYYKFYRSMFSIYSFTNGTGQVMQFYPSIIKIIINIWYIFVLALIPLILFIIFNKYFSYNKINLNKIKIYSKVLATLVIILYLFIINDKSYYNLKKILFETHAPMISVNQTGLYTTQILDIHRAIFGFKEKLYLNESINTNYDLNNNALEIGYKKSSDKYINKLNDYFNSISPTNKNNYTGLFTGKNIILINAESFDTVAIDKDLTPTLYHMANNSFVFNNFYQPLFPISTSDGEYMNLLGMLPKEGTWSLSKTRDNYLPYALGNVFKNIGYNTYAFHNHDYKYYDRDLVYPNLGFEYYACGNGLEKKMNCSGWPNSDLDMINATEEYIKKSEKFVIYYMTVSGHLSYSPKINEIARKNKSLVEDLNYSNDIKYYIATNIELDKAIERLLYILEENNKLNDTLIVIVPDHYPYGLTTKELNEKSSFNRDDKFDLYRTTLIMYNPNIKRTEIDKYVSGLDIVPTIYNLFGVQYDSRLYSGTDVFSNSEGIVMLSDRSWITNKGKYDSILNKYTPGMNKSYVKNTNIKVDNKFKAASLIIDTDYYRNR